MPAERKPGMDHPHYDWSPIATRRPLRWPDGARVALCVIVNLEHYEWKPPADAYMSPTLPGGSGRRAFPEMLAFSQREYGNRVGLFRVMQIMDSYGIRGTVAMDAMVAHNYPFIVQECKKRRWEFIGHGIAVNRMITSRMTEDQERQYIRESIEAVTRATGEAPQGWLGPEYGESTITPRLPASEGIRYLCDWPNDEQPYRMKVPVGQMYSLPINADLDDTYTHWGRLIPIMRYSQMIQEAFDKLYEDGAQSGRLLVLNLHPWLIGQPFRSKYLDEALAYVCRHHGVWKATGREIVEWSEKNYKR